MPQPPVSHSPLQTAFGFVAIALLVVVTGLGPRLTSRPDPAHDDPDATVPSAPAAPAAPSPAHQGLALIPVDPAPGVPDDPLTRR